MVSSECLMHDNRCPPFTTICPVPKLLLSRPPCLGVSRVRLISALVTSGAQKKSDRISAVINSRLRGVEGLMSPYL